MSAGTRLTLAEVQGYLVSRPLRVEADARPWTDTETVYLPPLVELASGPWHAAQLVA